MHDIVNTAQLYRDGKLLVECKAIIRKEKRMATCGCGCVYNATEIATADGVTTITVADGVLTDLCNRKIVNVGIFTAFTETSKCNEIEVTDGTTTLTIYNSGRCEGQPANQYWRPCALPCRKVLELRYLADPAVLVLRKVKVV